jgi:hypothetical protein
MSIKSLRQNGPNRFLIALLGLAFWPDVAATQRNSARDPNPKIQINRVKQKVLVRSNPPSTR